MMLLHLHKVGWEILHRQALANWDMSCNGRPPRPPPQFGTRILMTSMPAFLRAVSCACFRS